MKTKNVFLNKQPSLFKKSLYFKQAYREKV